LSPLLNDDGAGGAIRDGLVNRGIVGHRARGGLGFAVIPELKDGRDGSDAKSATDAKIFIHCNFFSH
jgi:hypothetical protein